VPLQTISPIDQQLIRATRAAYTRAVPRLWVAILVALLASLLAGEAAVRAFAPGLPGLIVPDPDTGYALGPGAQGWYRGEGESYVRVNSLGMADPERSIERPAGVFRVAVLGDDFTQAFNVDQEQRFTAVAERALGGCACLGGKSAEVLNFGVGGYGTTQELVQLRTRVLRFHPNVVVLAFFTGNDVADNLPSLRATLAPASQIGFPYATLKDGRLELDYTFRDSATWFGSTSPCARADTAPRIAFHLAGGITGLPLRARLAFVDGEPFEVGVLTQPTATRWVEAWAITDALIAAMADDSHAAGSDFAVLVIPAALQVNPDEQHRAAVLAKYGPGADALYAEQRIADLGAAHGFTAIRLVDDLHREAIRTGQLPHGFGDNLGGGHLNVTGHHLVGQALADGLCGQV
jgi:hypothetical protein